MTVSVHTTGQGLRTGWRRVALNDVIQPRFGSRITKKRDEGTKYPVYGGGGESFRTDNFNRQDDVVISRFAMSRQCVRFVEGPFFLLDSGFTFSIKESHSCLATKRYIAYALMSMQDEMYALGRGQAQKNLDVKAFLALEVPLPPVKEQLRLTHILDSQLEVIEEAKQAAEEQVEAVDALPGGYLREAIPSGDARLPKGWRWVKLGEVCSVIRGVTFKTRDTLHLIRPNYVACLTTSGVQDTPDWASRRYVEITTIKRSEQFLVTGDILVSTANSKELVGKSCIITDLPEQCTFGAFVTVVRLHDYISAKYVAYSMRTPESKAYFYNNSSNTTNISNLKATSLRALPIPLPPLPEQQRIVRALDEKLASVEKANQTAEAQVEAINALSTVCLRQAFAGEL